MSILEVLKLTLPEQRYRPLEPGEKITEDEAQARVEYALSMCMGSVIRLDPQNYGEIDPKQKAEIEALLKACGVPYIEVWFYFPTRNLTVVLDRKRIIPVIELPELDEPPPAT